MLWPDQVALVLDIDREAEQALVGVLPEQPPGGDQDVNEPLLVSGLVLGGTLHRDHHRVVGLLEGQQAMLVEIFGQADRLIGTFHSFCVVMNPDSITDHRLYPLSWS